MKFALLIHDDESWHGFSEQQQADLLNAHGAYVQALTEAGVMVGGEPLAHSREAVSVHGDGTVHDGPFIDSKEQLGGFYLIDVADRDEAVKWARRLPQCPPDGGAVEVRPVPDFGGGD
ncbi:MAG: YciI family protein [Pseudomonadota bacterium]